MTNSSGQNGMETLIILRKDPQSQNQTVSPLPQISTDKELSGQRALCIPASLARHPARGRKSRALVAHLYKKEESQLEKTGPSTLKAATGQQQV
jgi:hypothetical protein